MFELSKPQLMHLIKQRSRILNQIRQDKGIETDTANEMDTKLCNNLSDAVELVKAKWTSFLAKKVKDMQYTPKEAWKEVTVLKEGLTRHHAQPTMM